MSFGPFRANNYLSLIFQYKKKFENIVDKGKVIKCAYIILIVPI